MTPMSAARARGSSGSGDGLGREQRRDVPLGAAQGERRAHERLELRLRTLGRGLLGADADQGSGDDADHQEQGTRPEQHAKPSILPTIILGRRSSSASSPSAAAVDAAR